VFEEYMEQLCDGDEIMYNTLLELMGLCISNIPGYMTKKCILMYGKKDTGKTQIKKLLTKLIGIEYTSSIELSKISSNNFATSELYNKRLAGSNDMSYTGIEDLSIWKQLTGGDPISVEFKGRGAFSYIFTGLMWFLANDLPKFSGKKEEAIYERFIIIPCNNVIPKEKQDPYLFEKILAEKNSILQNVLLALKRLIENGYKFDEPESMKDNRKQYEVENNTFLTFIRECCEYKPDMSPYERTKKRIFKDAYDMWIKKNNNGKGKLNSKEIAKILEEEYNEYGIKSNGVIYMSKIIIKKEALEELGIYNE
jgi:P4 family phage/plasmid primase-like protien